MAGMKPFHRAWMWRLFFVKCLVLIVVPWSLQIPYLAALPTLSWSKNAHAFDSAMNWDQNEQPQPTASSGLLISPALDSSRLNSRIPTSDLAQDGVASLIMGTLPAVLFCLWSLGVVVQLALLWHNYCRVDSAIRRRGQRPEVTLQQLYRSTAKSLRISAPPPLKLIDASIGPALVMQGTCKVILPVCFRKNFGDEACRMAFAHELAHYVRKDVWWNALATVTSIPFFFFPPIWIALRRYRIAVESACDSQAIEAARLDRPSYAKLLVSILESPARRASPTVLTMARSESFCSLSERLMAMKITQQNRYCPVSRAHWLSLRPQSA